MQIMQIGGGAMATGMLKTRSCTKLSSQDYLAWQGHMGVASRKDRRGRKMDCNTASLMCKVQYAYFPMMPRWTRVSWEPMAYRSCFKTGVTQHQKSKKQHTRQSLQDWARKDMLGVLQGAAQRDSERRKWSAPSPMDTYDNLGHSKACLRRERHTCSRAVDQSCQGRQITVVVGGADLDISSHWRGALPSEQSMKPPILGP